MHRRTPCVGICSTTYGDLVCRGCKRFAHEVVGWNGFDAPQREAVWARLTELLEGAVEDFLEVVDAQALRACAERVRIARASQLSDAQLAHQVLLRAPLDLAEFGKVGLAARRPETESVLALMRGIEQEFLNRSRAAYERNYRITAQ